jgi:plastocyanin
LLLFIALASTAAGANASVDIANFAFDPPTVTINAGETVTWTNRDQAAHSAAFTSGGPKTPILTTGKSASLTFAVAGTFDYVCGIHGAAMMGTVIVRAVATPVPTVAPTVAPTLAPTVAPTLAPTPTASPSPTATASASPTAVATAAAPTIAAAVPTEAAAAPAASTDGGGPSPLIVAGAAIALVAVLAGVLTRIRR